MKLSVVIPVRNGARHLPACLDSLLSQTLKPDEVIVVDDGSTDGTFQVLADYAEKMSALRVIRQQNRGASAARNAGLEEARGRFLAFMDADDIASPDLYRTLVEMAEADQLDIALCNALYYFDGREPERLIYPNESDTTVMAGGDFLEQRLSRNSLLHVVWNQLYRRDFLTGLNLRFDLGITSEDVLWTTRALLAARRVRYTAKALYRYRIRHAQERPSGPTAVPGQRRMVESTVFNLKALNAIAFKESPKIARAVRWQAVDGALSVFHKINQIADSSTRAECWKLLRKEGFYGLLWRNAIEGSQRRRIISRWIKYGWR